MGTLGSRRTVCSCATRLSTQDRTAPMCAWSSRSVLPCCHMLSNAELRTAAHSVWTLEAVQQSCTCCPVANSWVQQLCPCMLVAAITCAQPATACTGRRVKPVCSCSQHWYVQVLGDNLLALIKAFNYRGIPLPLLRRLTFQVCPPACCPDHSH